MHFDSEAGSHISMHREVNLEDKRYSIADVTFSEVTKILQEIRCPDAAPLLRVINNFIDCTSLLILTDRPVKRCTCSASYYCIANCNSLKWFRVVTGTRVGRNVCTMFNSSRVVQPPPAKSKHGYTILP